MRLILLFVLVFSASVTQAGPIGSVGSAFVFEQSADGRNYDIQQPSFFEVVTVFQSSIFI